MGCLADVGPLYDADHNLAGAVDREISGSAEGVSNSPGINITGRKPAELVTAAGSTGSYRATTIHLTSMVSFAVITVLGRYFLA